MEGVKVGTVLTYPVCGWLLARVHWQAPTLLIPPPPPQWVFYATSGLSLVWCCLWFLMVHDLPEDHPRISDSERSMVMVHGA
jgi:hypothetical protein